MFTSVRVYRLSNANLTNQGLNKIFTDLCENLLKVRPHTHNGDTLVKPKHWCSSYLIYVMFNFCIN